MELSRMPPCGGKALGSNLFLSLLVMFLDYLMIDVTTSSSWEHLSLRYGTWYSPPRSPREAEAMGYKMVNDVCEMDTYYGHLYVHPDNDKSRLIFDFRDRLAGIQTAIPGNLHGFDSHNVSVRMPTKAIIPPILQSKEKYAPGLAMFTITAYFKHPSLVCKHLSHTSHPGKGLYIQMGYRPQRPKDYEKIPLNAAHLSTDWKTGTCLPSMGRHYFKKLTPNMPCEDLYPVFLMYNGDNQLGGFGWLFQGTPPPESNNSPLKWFKYTPQFYPAIFDQSMLPSCMFNPNFRVFGVRIYLRNENTMTCPRVQPFRPKEGKDKDDKHKTGHGQGTTKGTLKPFIKGKFNQETTFDSPEYTNSISTDQKLNSFSNKHHGRPGNHNNNNNVIVDDVMRNQGNGASDALFQSRCNIAVALVSSLFVSFICGLLSSSKNLSTWCAHILNGIWR